MSGLHEIWLRAQLEGSGANEELLLKSADGLVPISKNQLMQMIQNAAPGDSITLQGMTLTFGKKGEVEVTSTSQPGVKPDPKPFKKSADNGRGGVSFGDALLGLWSQKASRKEL